MKVEFDATLDDFVDCTNRVQKRTGILRRFMRLWVVFLAVVAGVLSFVQGRGSFRDNVIEGCTDAVVVGTLVTIFLIITRPIVRRLNRQLYRRVLGADGPIRIETEIMESGIVMKQQGTQTGYDWENVTAIEDCANSIEIWNRGLLMVVRDRAFGSKEQRDEFLGLCRKWFDAARVSSAKNREGVS